MNITNEIIKRCRKGNDSAYQELYNLSIRYVYAIVASYISDSESVKDVIQETYAGVFTSIKKYDSKKGNFKLWLRGICVNKCIQHYRKQNKFSEEIYFGDLLAPHPIETPDYEGLTREDIIQLLEQMPEGYRTVFLLVVIDGYNHQEVGEILGISPQTSRSQLHRAKNWIKKNIEPKHLDEYGIQRV